MRTLLSYMNDESYYLNSWWNPSFMWKERLYIYDISGVTNNFSHAIIKRQPHTTTGWKN